MSGSAPKSPFESELDGSQPDETKLEVAGSGKLPSVTAGASGEEEALPLLKCASSAERLFARCCTFRARSNAHGRRSGCECGCRCLQTGREP